MQNRRTEFGRGGGRGGGVGIGDVDKKIPDASALVATTNLNGKTSGVEKKNTRCE